MARFVLVAALFVAAFVGQAQAATSRPYYDGNTFFNTCSTYSATEIAHCNAYALGISDAIGVWKKTSPETAPACPDVGVTGEQILDIGFKYIKENVRERHKPTAILIMKAAGKEWPCKKQPVNGD